ncbi:hypothetical protein BpHYR1_009320 [Brachionus plicatilis]|uniref:Uncharacterized protein n=1 Tax=Brachionus plicatilis TaxID=10195 RepID=A0A3M7SZR4_BRAPC|nr:hypothetical protein BpHYR1_009320 [Brachionus plicatilis]
MYLKQIENKNLSRFELICDLFHLILSRFKLFTQILAQNDLINCHFESIDFSYHLNIHKYGFIIKIKFDAISYTRLNLKLNF